MNCEICEVEPAEPGAELCAQCAKLDHAVAFHGMNSHDCDCGPVPRLSCSKCRGHGFYFSFSSSRPCGPTCPMGNPQ